MVQIKNMKKFGLGNATDSTCKLCMENDVQLENHKHLLCKKRCVIAIVMLFVSTVGVAIGICYAVPSHNPDLDWSQWTHYGPCSASCGPGYRTRTRSCTGLSCTGLNVSTEFCYAGKCPAEGDVLLIAGGSSSSVEAVSLSDEKIRCDAVPPLPVKLTDAENGAYFIAREKPVFCAGDGHCYKYHRAAKAWRWFAELSVNKTRSAQLQLDGYFAVTGGHSTDYWDPHREEFIPEVKLPYPAGGHCIVSINETHALLTGGHHIVMKNHAYLFNRETREWTEIEPMIKQRTNHACGLVKNEKVIVAGGWNGQHIISSVEVYDLNTQTWRLGPDLLPNLSRATSVQLEDTFLIVGGYDDDHDRAQNTIYEFDVKNNTWVLRKQRMKVARDDQPAVWRVPGSYLNCVES